MRILSALMFAILLGGCASLTEHRVGLQAGGALQPCPSAPRCVSSQAADDRHRVDPLWLRDRDPATWQQVIRVVAAQPRTTLVKVDDGYLRAEIASPWGMYTDDLELLRVAGQKRTEVRSTARVGYYDFDVNRDRVEALRRTLADQDLLARRHP